MPRSAHTLAFGNAYGALLERLVPRLEQLLLGKLERLEAVVAFEESLRGGRDSAISARTANRPRRAAGELDAGRPSVILLGARLKSHRKYCRKLIQRASSLVRACVTAR